MTFKRLLFFALLFLSFTGFSYDSLRVEEKSGRKYIVHQVDEKETLYGLSRRYKVSIEEITRSNEGVGGGVNLGQIILIPFNKITTTKTHEVKTGETLFSIAKKYDVSVDELKKWNGLSSNSLSLGQELKISEVSTGSEEKPTSKPEVIEASGKTHTVKAGETLYSLSKKYDIPLRKLRKYNDLKGNDISLGQVLFLEEEDKRMEKENAKSNNNKEIGKVEETEKEIKEDPKPKKQMPDTIYVSRKKPVKNASGFEEIVENGLAEVIENNTDTRKYLALHRSVPVGTIIQVRNEDNNLRVFVRVIGKLPDTGQNENVLIKISKPAYERLGAVNQRFPVVISYVP
ncbi:MAG: LysM peptidoglycan-binding domain-containing protein [Bacteroidota bacterium]